ncbi:hypothetical protein BN77_2488 [Rhizobium mesoamericanum STM3625]|uniref:Uncharacterized protein n=1 Tax=Rhizobium mesoamericanum STM3625 TaxID=1211777 RepID=K0PZB5_9HYPH|nr:hypothetical protein BN77_2488 [Rhizobium mesoamericanum STM3625]
MSADGVLLAFFVIPRGSRRADGGCRDEEFLRLGLGAKLAAMTNKAQYVCVPTRYGLFNVVDAASGSPAEVGATTVFLTREEARRLIAWLNECGVDARLRQRIVAPGRSKADREYEGGSQWPTQKTSMELPRHLQSRTCRSS